MQFIRKNYPVLIAWFAYIAVAWLLKLLLSVGAVWLYQQFFPQSSWSSFPFLGVVIFLVAEYIGFSASVRWLAAPLSLLAKNIPTQPKPSLLFMDWLSFGYYFVLFCFPLLLINAFPGFTLNGFPYLVPISKESADMISFVWKYIVSLVIYRSIVNSYLKEKAEHSRSSEIQAPISG